MKLRRLWTVTMDYDALLDRAKDEIPEAISTGERFELPDLEVGKEGKTTVVRNFADVLDAMNRESGEVVPQLLRELGAAGDYEKPRLHLQGDHNSRTIQDRLDRYVENYVICTECGRPDTNLVKEDRTEILQCDACGAHRPVQARKQASQHEEEADAVEEGGTYEVKIEDTGRQGDGVAHVDKYTMFVTGAKKGQVVKAKVNNVSGTLAFADAVEIIEEAT
jgi:translation initiation factor 2 subunit 2